MFELVGWQTQIDIPCNRDDEVFVRKHEKRKAFHLGSNSSCRQHIRTHYEEYQQRCAADNIPENHHAVPREVLDAQKKDGAQMSLVGMFAKSPGPRAFSRDEVLKCVAEFIVCDDQVGSK